MSRPGALVSGRNLSSVTHPKESCRPNHVITFIRPRPKQSPTLATFMVPLAFNKLDLRDYLWHAYNVKVLSMRSYVSQQLTEKRNGMKGQTYRPRANKVMIAELEKPFVWPKAPEGEALQEFDNFIWKRVEAAKKDNLRSHEDRGVGNLRTRTERPTDPDRKKLAELARALVDGKDVWKNNTELDERWVEIEKDESKKSQ